MRSLGADNRRETGVAKKDSCRSVRGSPGAVADDREGVVGNAVWEYCVGGSEG